MGAAPKLRQRPMTVAEFLDWDSGDMSGRLWQLRDGMPEAMAPCTEPHGAIQGELAVTIGLHLRQAGSACRMIVTPGIVPRLRASDNVRIPDIAVTCTPPADRHLTDAPVLLIEILSRSNARQTWANVWSYATIPSASEILVVWSTRRRADLLRRQADGTWPEQPQRLGPDDTLELASIGLAVPLAALYVTSGIG